jgi:hypothetical protein
MIEIHHNHIESESLCSKRQVKNRIINITLIRVNNLVHEKKKISTCSNENIYVVVQKMKVKARLFTYSKVTKVANLMCSSINIII